MDNDLNSKSDKPSKEPKGRVFTLKALVALLQAWISLLSAIGSIKGTRAAKRQSRWNIKVGRRDAAVKLSQTDIDRLLQRHRDLKDLDKIAGMASSFRLPECDFFGDRNHVEKLVRSLIAANPPWLHVSRELSGADMGASTEAAQVLWRNQEVREIQDVTLFVPDESWRDKPLASLTMRPARHLGEVWQARLLDQILPPELLLDRCNRGEVLIPVRTAVHQRLEFLPEHRTMEITVRKPVPISIDSEGGGGKGGQLLYFLLDFSASMRGKPATLSMAVIAAVIRANIGRGDTRYLFRRYADKDELWPRAVEPPIEARTLEEKDRLFDTILSTNFNGRATNVNDALDVAAADVDALRASEHLEASILLVTDGQAEMLESTRIRLSGARIKVHTVMVTPERNLSLERLSESFTALDINGEIEPNSPSQLEPSGDLRPRRAYHI